MKKMLFILVGCVLLNIVTVVAQVSPTPEPVTDSLLADPSQDQDTLNNNAPQSPTNLYNAWKAVQKNTLHPQHVNINKAINNGLNNTSINGVKKTPEASVLHPPKDWKSPNKNFKIVPYKNHNLYPHSWNKDPLPMDWRNVGVGFSYEFK